MKFFWGDFRILSITNIKGLTMRNETIDIDSITASLERFTRQLEDVDATRFDELRKCSFFDPISNERLSHISKYVNIRSFDDGECLTTENGGLGAFYVILYGKVTVYYKSKVVGTIRAGECIGEGMFLASENISRLATVVADGEIITAEMKITGINNLFDDAETKASMDKALMMALFKKLQEANHRIEELLH